MRAWVQTAVVLAVVVGLVPAVAAQCGRPAYPDAGDYAEDSVEDGALWQRLVDAGGFAGAAEGVGIVRMAVADGAVTYTGTLEEVVVREYTGGGAVDAVVLSLTLRVDRTDGPPEVHAFTPVSAAGRAGGNLTLLVRLDGGAVDVFWRWAYLPCDEAFPNTYYVFHGRLEGDAVTGDNTLVYFEAPRPRRGPPADLILLVSAGIAVSAIFLLARRHLRRDV